jgi:protein ATS1
MYSVLCCGSNGNYQLGIGNDDDQLRLVYVKFLFNGKITTCIPFKPIDIICGGNHTFILMEDHQVFAAGDNTFGQLGLPIKEPTHIEVFTQIPGKFAKVAAGWEFSVLVNEQNHIYVCGNGPKGELGLGESIRHCELTKLPNLDIEIESIKSCMNHTIMILKQNQVYGWGVSRNGKLGITHKKTLSAPTRLVFDDNNDPDKIVAYNLGRDFTLVIFENNGIKLFGKFPQDFKMSTESLSPNDIASVQTMWSSNHFKLKAKNDILSIGNNSHGQLFPGRFQHPIDEFAVGSEHGVIRCGNQVFAWGWGEHGNCGRINKAGEVVVGYFNEIYRGQDNVEFIRGGCATTWVVVR